MPTDASRLSEARKQVQIVLDDGEVGPLVASDLEAALMNLDGCIDALDAEEVAAE